MFFFGGGVLPSSTNLDCCSTITLSIAREYVLSFIFLWMYMVFVEQWVKVSKHFYKKRSNLLKCRKDGKGAKSYHKLGNPHLTLRHTDTPGYRTPGTMWLILTGGKSGLVQANPDMLWISCRANRQAIYSAEKDFGQDKNNISFLSPKIHFELEQIY